MVRVQYSTNIKLGVFYFASLFFALLVKGQNTVGLMSIDQSKTVGGYNLIYPENQPTVFLLNECGEIVHLWEDSDDARPGKTAYLLENGDLLKSKSDNSLVGVSFGVGGAGGIVEIRSWENELQWSFTMADTLNRQHHDVLFMENGHVLMIIWERKSFGEIIENGFDTLSNPQETLWPDYILEIDPNTNESVWEWHAWDHIIQEFDPSKLNYGTVSEHPELININYQEFSFERQDFMHCNAIDYDPVKDQIILSARNYNEIFIIDHSTTTAEAAGHAGGNSGKGGDLIYRWGNPITYKKGTEDDQKLFYQHDAQWIDDFVNPSYEHYGKILVFNNMVGDGLSLGQIFAPVWNETTHSYEMDNGVYLPVDFTKTISHPDTSKNHSTSASSIQILENGNVVICAARQGFMFELTSNGEIAWEYKTPLKNGFPIPQGYELSLSDNFTFQCERYPEYYAGFSGRDLSSKGYIEIEPDISSCMFTSTEKFDKKGQLRIYPNPVSDYLFIEKSKSITEKLEVINQYGQAVFYSENAGGKTRIDVSAWPQGIYYLKANAQSLQKLVVVH